MEIRCNKCDYVGEAAEVRKVSGGVGLVCSRCSFTTVLKLSDSNEKHVNVAGNTGENLGAQADMDAVLYLVPAVGEGARCPKCLALTKQSGGEERTHCARCGLEISGLERFAPGSAPWEVAPAGKEAAFAQAEQLWPASGAFNAASLDAWCDHVEANDLLDYAIRKLQLQLIEVPGNRLALAALARIEKKLQQRVFVATTEAELSAKAYSGEVATLRKRLLMFSLIFWLGIFILFAMFFWR